MTLPNLILAGFPKCGTTSVAETLVRHPEVCGSFPHLRTRYFTPLLYDPSAVLPPVAEYAAHYSRWNGERFRLDDTPVWAYGGARITAAVRAALGAPRVLIMLREPASRTVSYLTWKKRHGEVAASLSLASYVDECLAHGPRAVDTAALNPWSGLYGSDYARFLPAWLAEFGDDLRVGFLDDLIGDPVGFYAALSGWLGISAREFTADTVQVANTALAARSPRAERAIRRVGRRVQPLARHAPGVYRALRNSARRANMTAVAPPATDDAAARARLREFFAPGLPALADLVRGRELVRLPSWLAD